MTTFSMHLVNSHFTCSNLIEASSPDAARAEALKGALEIGAEAVCDGETFFGAEVRVLKGDEVVGHLMVAIGTTTLQ